MSVKKVFESLHKVNEKIVKVGSKWQVQSEDGKKVLGSYDTKEAAEQRLKQIEAFKHMDEGSNAYDYGNYVIIQTSSGWRIKKDDEFIGGEYSTDKDAEEYIDSLNEDYDADPRPNETRLWKAVENDELDARHVLDDLLRFLSDDVIGEFIESEYENLLESSETNESTIDENYEDEMAGNEEPEIMSTEAFVNWHDKEFMSPEFDFKVEKIYKIFADNNCSEEDDVDVCYDSLSDEDKKKVTEIIRKGGY